MPTSDDLLTRLIPIVTAEIQDKISHLTAQGVPPAASAQIMLRLAATMIRDIDGPTSLRIALDDTTRALLTPRD